MTKKTVRRNIDVVSNEEWKALVKAQELNRTQLLRSGMGTGTGTSESGGSSEPETYSDSCSIYDVFTYNGIDWMGSGSFWCIADVRSNGYNYSIDITSITLSFRLLGGSGEDIVNGHAATLQGNNISIFVRPDEFAGTSHIEEVTFTIHRTTDDTDEEGNPVILPSLSTTGILTFSISANYDPSSHEFSLHGSVSIDN